MIPKIIHFIWFGGKKTKLAKKCIASWRKFCPDYEIMEWNESNFDVNKSTHCRQAFESKKYGFVVDYARYDLLFNYGGIYVDTDVEFLKNMDALLNTQAFVGFESEHEVATGQIVASVKGNAFIKDLMDYYKDLEFFDENGNPILVTSTTIITNLLRDKYGLKCDNTYQELSTIGLKVYPCDYFQPIKDGKLILTENTYSIHHFSSSWVDKDYSQRKEYIALYGRKKGLFLYILRHPIKSIKKALNRSKHGQ